MPAEPPDNRPVVAMAGASGFVGSAVREALRPHFRLLCLTRSTAGLEHFADDPDIEWRACDLFSLLELEEALQGADYAVYLVHSMLPSARLLQGSFADLDLILADNFARAAQHCGVRHVVYLGGLIPGPKALSPHLASRLEVEETLGSGKSPVTALRASLIVGPGGSSLRIVVNLVRRLPVMILPAWTRTRTQPIAIEDVVRAVVEVLRTPPEHNRHFDIGGPDVITYREMLARTAAALGRRRLFIDVPIFTTGLSKLWVALLGGASRYLVGPLVDSLKHPMVARPNPLQEQLRKDAIPFDSALRASLDESGRLRPNPRDLFRRTDKRAIHRARRVRSVQRLPLPPGHRAEEISREYFRWLPSVLRPLLRREEPEAGRIRLNLLFRGWTLIEFEHAPFRSRPDRQLYYITGGWLARTRHNRKGRIEFREMLDRRCLIIAIHDFTPTLPWPLYRRSQAIFHLVVMGRFSRHLSRMAPAGDRPADP